MKTPVLERWAFGRGDDPAFVQFLERTHLTPKRFYIADRKRPDGWMEFGWVDHAKMAEEWFGVPAQTYTGSEQEKLASAARRLLALMEPLDVLDEPRRAAVARPCSELMRAAAIPQIEPLRVSAARFQLARGVALGLAAHGSPFFAEGLHDEAYLDALAGLKLTRGYVAMPDASLVESMIGVVLTKIALQAVWEGCQLHAWSEAELRQFESEFSSMHPAASLAAAMRTDRVSMVLTYRQASLRVSNRPGLFWLYWPQGWLHEGTVLYCMCMQDGLDALAKAGTELFLQTKGEALARLDHRFSSLSPWESLRLAVGIMAVPAFTKPSNQSV
ncbi:MAG TPA: hypothetical protein VK163_02880 [Opitutaceae bacterium]|nr:hypothetical protein [Opitutaceae bacterium]